jgi:HAD superfamily hydrolase (TIGR01509 family)
MNPPGKTFRAVLFDWRRTLVHDPPIDRWLSTAFASIGRQPTVAESASIRQALIDAFERPEYAALDRRMDTSAEQHRADMMTVFGWAGLDGPLADALYEVDFDPNTHALYPGVVQVLTDIRRRGLKTALVSNIHFDLRPELEQKAVLDLFDVIILSFEHGIQKPDPEIFQLALDASGVEASDAIMVGDSEAHDGGAASLGITTVILPRLTDFARRDFSPVLHLLDEQAPDGA